MTAILPTALSGTQSNGTDRPDQVGNPKLAAGQRSPSRWFNTAAFQAPPVFFDAQGAFSIPGSEGRNTVTGPGLAVWDLSLQRQILLTERLNLVFRTDAFNLTNHPNFDRPGTLCTPPSFGQGACLGTSNFGRITSAENSRQIQFSMRLNW